MTGVCKTASFCCVHQCGIIISQGLVVTCEDVHLVSVFGKKEMDCVVGEGLCRISAFSAHERELCSRSLLPPRRCDCGWWWSRAWPWGSMQGPDQQVSHSRVSQVQVPFRPSSSPQPVLPDLSLPWRVPAASTA